MTGVNVRWICLVFGSGTSCSPVGSEVLAEFLRFDPQKSMLRSPARTSEPTGDSNSRMPVIAKNHIAIFS